VIEDCRGALILIVLSVFCSAVLNLFSKNMSTAVENFQVKQFSATSIYVKILFGYKYNEFILLFELLN
jgi:uncharacterized membrane protein YwzB